MQLLLYKDDRVLPLIEKAKMLMETTKKQMVLADTFGTQPPVPHSLRFVRDISSFTYTPVSNLKEVHSELVTVYNTTKDASSIFIIRKTLKELEKATVEAYNYAESLKESTPLHDSFALGLVPSGVPSVHLTLKLTYDSVLIFEYTYFIGDMTIVLRMWGDLISINGELTTKLGAEVLMRSLSCKA